MTAELLDGERLAGRHQDGTGRARGATHGAGRMPGLGTLLVGDDPSSARYVRDED